MTKTNIKYLKQNTLRFNANEVTDIPPFLWRFIGFNGRNENKVNFLIHMIQRIYG